MRCGCKTIQAKIFAGPKPDLPEPHKFFPQLPLFSDSPMSAVTRPECSRRPPLDRDQAMLPITQRQERRLSRDEPMEPITQRSEELSVTNMHSESSVGVFVENRRPEMPSQMATITYSCNRWRIKRRITGNVECPTRKR